MQLLTEKMVNSLFLLQDAAEYTDMYCFLIKHATSHVILKFRNLRQALGVLCLIINASPRQKPGQCRHVFLVLIYLYSDKAWFHLFRYMDMQYQ